MKSVPPDLVRRAATRLQDLEPDLPQRVERVLAELLGSPAGARRLTASRAGWSIAPAPIPPSA